MPLDCVTRSLQLPAGCLAQHWKDHRILQAVAEKNGRRLIDRAALGIEPRGQQLVTGEPDDAGETLRVADSAEKRHGATLRESGEHDAIGADAACVLAA